MEISKPSASIDKAYRPKANNAQGLGQLHYQINGGKLAKSQKVKAIEVLGSDACIDEAMRCGLLCTRHGDHQ